jgi:hypothetical protein
MHQKAPLRTRELRRYVETVGNFGLYADGKEV